MPRIRITGPAAALTALTLALATPAAAQEPQLEYPIIQKYGGVVAVQGTTAKRAEGEPYRVVFDISEAPAGENGVSAELASVARFVNLLGISNIEPRDSQIVAVLHGEATPMVLNEFAYKTAFGTPNPNADLITHLTNHGVEIVICGQALAGAGFKTGQVMEQVEVSLSAMTELANLQMEGYALIP